MATIFFNTGGTLRYQCLRYQELTVVSVDDLPLLSYLFGYKMGVFLSRRTKNN